MFGTKFGTDIHGSQMISSHNFWWHMVPHNMQTPGSLVNGRPVNHHHKYNDDQGETPKKFFGLRGLLPGFTAQWIQSTVSPPGPTHTFPLSPQTLWCHFYFFFKCFSQPEESLHGSLKFKVSCQLFYRLVSYNWGLSSYPGADWYIYAPHPAPVDLIISYWCWVGSQT